MEIGAHQCGKIESLSAFQQKLPSSNQGGHRWNLVRFSHALIDFSTIAVALVVPYLLGGRFIGGKFAFYVLMIPGAVGTTILCIHAPQRSPRMLWIGLTLLFVAIPLIQLTPLPHPVHSAIAPGSKSFAPYANSITDLRPLSLVPLATRESIPLRCAYAILFVMVYIRVNTYRIAERLLALIAVAIIALNVISIFQIQFGNGLFLWLYDHPYRKPGTVLRGPFQNQNHLAQMLTLGLSALLYWTWVNRQSLIIAKRYTLKSSRYSANILKHVGHSIAPRILASLGIALVVSSTLATGSRGGILVVLLTLANFTTIQFVLWIRQKNAKNASIKRFLTIAILAGLASTIGITLLSLLHHAKTLGYWRFRIWSTDFDIWQNFPLLGTGEGTHRYVYSSRFNEYFPQPFTHAESSLVELLLETGLVGVMAILIPVGIVLYKLSRNLVDYKLDRSRRIALLAILVAILASLCHATCDFVWHIPSCAIYAIILGTIGIKITDLSETSEIQTTPTLSANTFKLTPWIVTGLSGILVLMTWQTFPAVRASQLWDKIAIDERSYGESRVKIDDPLRMEQVAKLTEILTVSPQDHRAASKLAILFAERARTSPLQVERIAHSDRATSYANLAIRLCPLDSNAYLAAAIAMESKNSEQQGILLSYAENLNRCDSAIYLELGKYEVGQGNLEKAFQHWRRAMNLDPENRHQVLTALANAIPVQLILSDLQPDQAITEQFYKLFQKMSRPDDLRQIADRLIKMLCTLNNEDPPTTEDYLRAFAIASETDSLEQQASIANQAVDSDANIWAHRYMLAQSLYRSKHFDKALPHLQWCLERRSGEIHIRTMLERSLNALKKEHSSLDTAQKRWRSRTTASSLY